MRVVRMEGPCVKALVAVGGYLKDKAGGSGEKEYKGGRGA